MRGGILLFAVRQPAEKLKYLNAYQPVKIFRLYVVNILRNFTISTVTCGDIKNNVSFAMPKNL
jgi:hypothetical protein